MYNGFKGTAKQPTLLANIIGMVNSMTLVPILAVAVIGALIYKGFNGSEAETIGSELLNEPLDQPLMQPLPSRSQAVELAVEPTVETIEKSIDEEALKKEMLRQVMSELGKKSAEKRRQNKQ